MPNHDLPYFLLHVLAQCRYRHDRLTTIQLLTLPFELFQFVPHTQEDPVDLAA